MFNLIDRAYAASVPRITIPTLNPISGSFPTLSDIILNIVNWILWLAGVVAVGYLIYGGILYITAGGDAEKATKGRTALINAIIGIVIVLLALAIITWIKRFLGSSGTSL